MATSEVTVDAMDNSDTAKFSQRSPDMTQTGESAQQSQSISDPPEFADTTNDLKTTLPVSQSGDTPKDSQCSGDFTEKCGLAKESETIVEQTENGHSVKESETIVEQTNGESAKVSQSIVEQTEITDTSEGILHQTEISDTPNESQAIPDETEISHTPNESETIPHKAESTDTGIQSEGTRDMREIGDTDTTESGHTATQSEGTRDATQNAGEPNGSKWKNTFVVVQNDDEKDSKSDTSESSVSPVIFPTYLFRNRAYYCLHHGDDMSGPIDDSKDLQMQSFRGCDSIECSDDDDDLKLHLTCSQDENLDLKLSLTNSSELSPVHSPLSQSSPNRTLKDEDEGESQIKHDNIVQSTQSLQQHDVQQQSVQHSDVKPNVVNTTEHNVSCEEATASNCASNELVSFDEEEANNEINLTLRWTDRTNISNVTGFHIREIENLQSMLLTGVGCSNDRVKDALSLIKRRVVTMKQTASSFFDAIADQLAAHPTASGVYTGTNLRAFVYKCFMEHRQMIEGPFQMYFQDYQLTYEQYVVGLLYEENPPDIVAMYVCLMMLNVPSTIMTNLNSFNYMPHKRTADPMQLELTIIYNGSYLFSATRRYLYDMLLCMTEPEKIAMMHSLLLNQRYLTEGSSQEFHDKKPKKRAPKPVNKPLSSTSDSTSSLNCESPTTSKHGCKGNNKSSEGQSSKAAQDTSDIQIVGSSKKGNTCNICDESFYTKSNLARHIMIHRLITDPTCTVCIECQKAYKTVKTFHNHILSKHNKLRPGEEKVVTLRSEQYNVSSSVSSAIEIDESCSTPSVNESLAGNDQPNVSDMPPNEPITNAEDSSNVEMVENPADPSKSDNSNINESHGGNDQPSVSDMPPNEPVTNADQSMDGDENTTQVIQGAADNQTESVDGVPDAKHASSNGKDPTQIDTEISPPSMNEKEPWDFDESFKKQHDSTDTASDDDLHPSASSRQLRSAAANRPESSVQPVEPVVADTEKKPISTEWTNRKVKCHTCKREYQGMDKFDDHVMKYHKCRVKGSIACAVCKKRFATNSKNQLLHHFENEHIVANKQNTKEQENDKSKGDNDKSPDEHKDQPGPSKGTSVPTKGTKQNVKSPDDDKDKSVPKKGKKQNVKSPDDDKGKSVPKKGKKQNVKSPDDDKPNLAAKKPTKRKNVTINDDKDNCPPTGTTAKKAKEEKNDDANMTTMNLRGKPNCILCPKNFNTKEELQTHLKAEHSKEAEKLKCKQCGEKFPTVKSLNNHVHTVHRKNICPICKEDKGTKRALNIHISRDHKTYDETQDDSKTSDNYTCNFCGSRFESKAEIVQHMDSHITVKKEVDDSQEMNESKEWCVCIICDKTFPTQLILTAHIVEDHKKKRNPHVMGKDKVKKVRIDEPNITCPTCGKIFISAENYTKHIESHKKQNNKKKAKVAPRKSTRILKSAAKKHGTYCITCQKNFPSKAGLDSHYEKVHSKQTRFNCEECKKSFSTKYTLKYHVNTEHKGLRYNCTYKKCDASFKRKDSLEAHIMNHRGEAKFVCPTCGKGFYHKGHYEGHLNSHVGAKPHLCPKCNKGFPYKADVSKHLNICGVNDLPFKCNVGMCKNDPTRRFATLTYLHNHEFGYHHLGDPIVCNKCGFQTYYPSSFENHMMLHKD